jgi:REP element-mobilizing transposase RayT
MRVPPVPSVRRCTRLAASEYVGRFVMVTICTHERRHLFGVVGRERRFARVELSAIGEIVRCEWNASVIEKVVVTIMPDHMHGIVRVGCVPLSIFVAGFKAAVTSRVRREVPDDVRRVWQRGYHDRVLREHEIERAVEYIATNPTRFPL